MEKYVTFSQMIKIIEDKQLVEDICWLDDYDGLQNEEISCETHDGKEIKLLIEKQLFDYELFFKWCENNKDRFWKGNRVGDKIRGVDYFWREE